MKLVQLYSNHDTFKTIKFSSGFNLILGKITDKENLDKDCHNLGKSTLVELIDFMLLKEIDKKHFLKQKEFKNHVFYLEIQINSQKYVTIKRATNKSTKISFKISQNKFNNYVDETIWDYEDLPLTSHDSSKNPKKILQNLLSFNLLSNFSYRSYINYFLRTQSDYSDEFHLSKYAGSDSDWKPLLFELLGFNCEQLILKYNYDKDIASKKEYINKLEKSMEIEDKLIDKYKGLIRIKEKEKASIEKTLDKFDFYLQEQKINKDTVDEVEQEISSLNSKRYNLEIDIANLNSSLEHKVNFDLEATKRIFEEVSIYFSEQLEKSYEDLINFNKTLTNDRNSYVIESRLKKESELNKINKQLILLNEKRTSYLSLLTETDTFKKYKSYEKKLIEIERDIEKYNSKLEDSEILVTQKDELAVLENELESLKKIIRIQVDKGNERYEKIRDLFNDYVNVILGKNGLLSITPNKLGNLEFLSEIYSDDNVITAQGKGHSYKKILCACFDLAILTSYSDENFIKFVYHDGCLETLDPRKKKNYLNLVSELCEKYNIQYILTSLESDLPIDDSFKLPKNCHIAVELTDEDDTSNLFGFTF
nr:MAG TPA: putative ATPase [Caudoviricetes sp.]